MNKVAQIIADKLVQGLEKGNIAWQRPWKIQGLRPQNAVTKRTYNGVNVLLTSLFSPESPYFMTAKQAFNANGEYGKHSGVPQKGKAIPIVFWQFIKKKNKDGTENSFPFLRYYNVWSVKDIDWQEGKEWKKPEVNIEKIEFNPIDEAEKVLALHTDLSIKHGGDVACFYPSDMKIDMPEKEFFNSVEDYYKVLFHEVGHWSRFKVGQSSSGRFGNENYAFEELRAEICANIVCGEIGIDISDTFDNSQAYINGWIKILKDHPTMIITAANHAEKRAEFIVNPAEFEQKQEKVS